MMSGRQLGSRVMNWTGRTDSISFEGVCGLGLSVRLQEIDCIEGRTPLNLVFNTAVMDRELWEGIFQ